MTTGQKALWITVGIVAVAAIGVTTAAAVVANNICRGGIVRVAVVDRGADPVSLDIVVPTPLAGLAVTTAAHWIPDEELRAVRRELGDLGPLLRALADELERCPDAVLVEVDDGSDHVEIVKDGGRLIVRVRSEDADVDVEVPVALVGHTLRALEV